MLPEKTTVPIDSSQRAQPLQDTPQRRAILKKLRSKPSVKSAVIALVVLLLVVLLVLLGFYPQPILDTSHSAIGNIQQWFVNSVTTTRP